MATGSDGRVNLRAYGHDLGGRRAAREEAPPDHRRVDAAVDRVLRGAGMSGARRRDRADRLRPGDEHHREGRQAAARSAGRPRDGRERSRADRGAPRRAGDAVGHRRRIPARDRVRAAGRTGRELPQHPVGERGDRDPDERLLVEGDRGGTPAVDGGARRLGRQPRFRRAVRVAGLRLDGCRQGRARGRDPLPREGPRPHGHQGEHRVGRPAEDDGGQGHPGVRADRRHLGTSRPAGMGHVGSDTRGPGHRVPVLGPVGRDHRRDDPRGRRLPRHGHRHSSRRPGPGTGSVRATGRGARTRSRSRAAPGRSRRTPP